MLNMLELGLPFMLENTLWLLMLCISCLKESFMVSNAEEPGNAVAVQKPLQRDA